MVTSYVDWWFEPIYKLLTPTPTHPAASLPYSHPLDFVTETIHTCVQHHCEWPQRAMVSTENFQRKILQVNQRKSLHSLMLYTIIYYDRFEHGKPVYQHCTDWTTAFWSIWLATDIQPGNNNNQQTKTSPPLRKVWKTNNSTLVRQHTHTHTDTHTHKLQVHAHTVVVRQHTHTRIALVRQHTHTHTNTRKKCSGQTNTHTHTHTHTASLLFTPSKVWVYVCNS